MNRLMLWLVLWLLWRVQQWTEQTSQLALNIWGKLLILMTWVRYQSCLEWECGSKQVIASLPVNQHHTGVVGISTHSDIQSRSEHLFTSPLIVYLNTFIFVMFKKNSLNGSIGVASEKNVRNTDRQTAINRIVWSRQMLEISLADRATNRIVWSRLMLEISLTDKTEQLTRLSGYDKCCNYPWQSN